MKITLCYLHQLFDIFLIFVVDYQNCLKFQQTEETTEDYKLHELVTKDLKIAPPIIKRLKKTLPNINPDILKDG